MPSLGDTRRWFRRWMHTERILLHEMLDWRKRDSAQWPKLAALLAEGGLARTCDLAVWADGTPRTARLVMQLDGDIMLFVPADFGTSPDDGSRIAALQMALANELAAMQAGLPYHWAALWGGLLRIVSTGFVVYGIGSATAASITELWQAPPSSLADGAAVLWHSVLLSWHAVAVAGGAVSLQFGRHIRLWVIHGGIWLARSATLHATQAAG